MSFVIQTISEQDQRQVQAIVRQYWGDDPLIIHRKIFSITSLNGLKATLNNTLVGILHYQITRDECEILTLASLQQGQGVGTALLNKVESIARNLQCCKLSVITTNDNLHALGFYQRRGFQLAALFPGQVNVSRTYKPTIPEIAENGIPIRDEIQLIKRLTVRTFSAEKNLPNKGRE